MRTPEKPTLQLAKKCLIKIQDIAARAASSETLQDISVALTELGTLLSFYWTEETVHFSSPEIEYVSVPGNPLLELYENLATLEALFERIHHLVELKEITRSSHLSGSSQGGRPRFL
jgi:hypothetical protein